jgi:type VI protein secretion system component VasK
VPTPIQARERPMTDFLDILGAIAVIWIFWAIGRIIERLGYNMLWGLLIFVPGVNFLAILYVAYFRWPIDDDAEAGEIRGRLWRRPRNIRNHL